MKTYKLELDWFQFYRVASKECPKCRVGARVVRARELLLESVHRQLPEFPEIVIEIDASVMRWVTVILPDGDR